MKRKTILHIIFALLVAIIFLPNLYLPFMLDKLEHLQAKSLGGAFEESHKPTFWMKKWMSGKYQKAYGNYVRDQSPITPFFVRSNTEINYHAFRNIPHENLLVGSNEIFFTKSDCEASIGFDFLGQKKIDNITEQLAFIQNHYAEKGIPWLILCPPNKASVLSKQLPDFYQHYPIDSTNRKTFRQKFIEKKITFMDFEFFNNQVDTSSYPLYPQAGLHWTYYGFALAADSIKNRVEQLTDISLPRLQWRDSIIVSDNLIDNDYDLLGSANFLKRPNLRPMPYPKVRYLSDSTTQDFKVLSVGDSFYKLLYDCGIHDGLFHEASSFWYYYSTPFPTIRKDGKNVGAKSLDVLKEIDKHDFVILTVYESNLDVFGFEFVETVYEALKNEKSE